MALRSMNLTGSPEISLRTYSLTTTSDVLIGLVGQTTTLFSHESHPLLEPIRILRVESRIQDLVQSLSIANAYSFKVRVELLQARWQIFRLSR